MNDEIRLKFKEFDTFEYALRQQRREKLNASIANSRTTTSILAGITLLVGIISAVYITRTIIRRISSMVNLAEDISKGKFEVIEDTENDELSRLSDSLNVMSQKLKSSFSELDQFAYVVSHDLKAPLRGMYNIVLWIEEDCASEISRQMQSYLDKMKGRIQRMEGLISGLLEYTKIGRVVKSVEKVDVQELVNEIVESVVPRNFQVKIDKNLPTIKTEKIKLEQIFSNLISNAVKYHGEKEGKIIVSCKDKDDFFEFSIADNGIGIMPEYHEKIFKIFQTLREKDEQESAGVGLAIVKKIVEEKKGTIKVISGKGQGATFIFTWPKEMEEVYV